MTLVLGIFALAYWAVVWTVIYLWPLPEGR